MSPLLTPGRTLPAGKPYLSRNFGAALVQSDRDRSVSRILGRPLVARGRGNGRNPDFSVALLERDMLSGRLARLALTGAFTHLGSDVLHHRTPFPCLISDGPAVGGESGGNERQIVHRRDIACHSSTDEHLT